MKIIVLMIGLIVLFYVKIGFCANIVAGNWDPNTEPELTGYVIYICSTYQKALGRSADIAEFTVPALQLPYFCYDLGKKYKLVFIAVTATDKYGNESEPAIAYRLAGNVYGDFNDGFSRLNARVDGMDLATMGLYFGLTTSHQNITCGHYTDLKIPTYKQRSDLNRDGRINGFDLIELGIRFGNKAY